MTLEDEDCGLFLPLFLQNEEGMGHWTALAYYIEGIFRVVEVFEFFG